MNFTAQEKTFMELINSSLVCFNEKRKKKLTVDYYVDGGNVARVSKNGNVLLSGISIEDAFYAVVGIIRFMEV